MSGELAGKVTLVTGGSSGIGLASATRFVEAGAYVYITGRRQAELDAACAKIGRDVAAIRADASQLDDLERVFDRIRGERGRLDVVLANAGILEKAPIGEMTEAHFDRLFSINVKGLVFTVQEALPLMTEGGSIVLMSSTVAGKGMGNNSLYAATKAAIRSFARGWIVDLKARGIRVNAISPGPIETPGLREGVGGGDEVLVRMAGQIPLGRLGTPEDVANVALFLASSQSAFVNGADLAVDGGWAQI